uniref:Uncharacterized protein n=1 Tax=Rhizophora mucronata TaxID=61149 RepID=A0A2P2QEX6_RHIMU
MMQTDLHAPHNHLNRYLITQADVALYYKDIKTCWQN